MKKTLIIVGIISIALLTAGPIWATTIDWDTAYLLRDSDNDGSVDAAQIIDDDDFRKTISETSWTGELFFEFDISGNAATTEAYLDLSVLNPSWNYIYGSAKTFKVAYYVGNGEVDYSDFGTGTFFLEYSLAEQTYYSLHSDITDLYNSFLDSGYSYLGFRLYDPYWVYDPSLGSQIVVTSGELNVGDSAADPVPEPATMFLLGTGLMLLPGARRRLKR